MTCIKKIQNSEVYGSKFSSRTLTTAGDISEFSFKAVVKNIIQGKILEIPGVKNAGTINFDFSQLETLKKSTYQIEYWGDFGALGNEPFLLEELSIVSAENATNCANSDNLNFEIKVEEISIPLTITKAINNFSLNIENLTPEQIAQLKGDKGDKGEKGDAGLQGIQGIQGMQGVKGDKGDAGEKGDKGDKGDTGATGLQGIQGMQGDKGEKGDKGDKGDAFTYADFTPTQIAELQKPATDKVEELDALEATLTNSENLRVQNENTRKTSENTRNTNEQTRITSENNRVTAENTRKSAETTRVNAETERVSNESERKTAETARVSAENTRSTAETSRANAENTRSNAENTRISNENDRVTAENTRISNENSRVTAENNRVSNESSRVSAENARVTAENARVAAENARVAAELERQNNKKSFTHDILVSNWTLVGGKYEAVISNVGILANSFVDVIPSNDHVDIVRAAQIYPSVLISAGSVKVYSKFLPSGTISVTINVI